VRRSAAEAQEGIEARPCYARTYEKNRGRIEERILESTSLLTRSLEWKGLKQGFRLTRKTKREGKWTTEVVHGITSLSLEEADAERLLELSRRHWHVENRSHYVRDETLGEDKSRIRSGSAPEVMAGCRNIARTLLGTISSNTADAIRYLGTRLVAAIGLLCPLS
jgi:predicted transposase YbfD/YdcC